MADEWRGVCTPGAIDAILASLTSGDSLLLDLIHPAAGVGEAFSLFDKGLIDDGAEVGAVGSIAGILYGLNDIADVHWLACLGEDFFHGSHKALAVARAGGAAAAAPASN